ERCGWMAGRLIGRAWRQAHLTHVERVNPSGKTMGYKIQADAVALLRDDAVRHEEPKPANRGIGHAGTSRRMGNRDSRIARGFAVDEDFDTIDALVPAQHPALEKACLTIEKAAVGAIQAGSDFFAGGKGDLSRKYESQQHRQRRKRAQEGGQPPATDDAERHVERQPDGA